ncbi:hypothetical protein TIFTF001_026377 [Ficus carica]|uniref:WAT1-related protein n=1 Tax=Ficus carica TaxID=3494 RepID=A0AA88DLA2_FICCA|nr:hypothetical protein TIFTF001_026377 [Ficus carica]
MPATSTSNTFHQAKLLCAVIFIQSIYAGLSIISMFALKEGMSHYVFVVYRMAIASAIIAPFAVVLDRKSRPKLTLSVLAKIILLSLFDPVLDQNLYCIGMKNTTATFTSAMCNMLPAFAFVMAWIFRLEVVNVRRLQSLAKVLGTIATVGGAMMMTLIKGPLLNLPWTRAKHRNFLSESADDEQDLIKGTLAIVISCTVLALVVEWRNNAVWSIQPDAKLLAAIYGGILSGVGYYILVAVTKEKGPVFYSAFNPLTTIIVAILASIIIAEQMYLGRVIGAVIIIGGLYLVLWGKSKDEGRSPPNSQVEPINDDTIDENRDIEGSRA